MQLFKRIGATILVVLVLVSITASCFATAATAQAIDVFGSLYSAYLLSKGVDVVAGYNDGILGVYDSENPMPEASWRELWQDNFDYYSSLVDSSIQDVDDWVTTYGVYISNGYLDANGDFHSGSPIDPDPDNKLGFALSAQIVEWFDKFTNAIFKGKYNLSNNGSGFVYNTNSFDSPISESVNFSLNGLPLQRAYVGMPFVINYYGGTTLNISELTAPSDVYMWMVPNSARINCISLSPGFTYVTQPFGYGGPSNNGSVVVDGVTYYWGEGNAPAPILSGLPVLSFYASQIPSDATVSDSGDNFKLQTRGQATINVPDTDDEDYVPLPLEIPINTPYVTTSAAPDFSDISDPNVQQYIDPVIQDSTTNTLTSPETSPSNPDLNEPSPVMPPFLPFELPSFDFSLSGIWYYVVRWVDSIGSGASLLFSVFANIPAAMFYPVFGSAVVVIVIGLWKRFLT